MTLLISVLFLAVGALFFTLFHQAKAYEETIDNLRNKASQNANSVQYYHTKLNKEREILKINVYVIVDLTTKEVIGGFTKYKEAMAELQEEIRYDSERELGIFFAKLRHFREMNIRS
jgi:hypothetical protein